MKINLKSKIPFKIKKNPYNKTFLPKGLFLNIPKIKHNNTWYECVIKFEGDTLIISRLILHHKNSSIVKEYLTGEFHREKVSSLKKNWILFVYNTHPLNYKIFYFKKGLVNRKKTISVFGLAILLSIIYYLINLNFQNSLMNWIANSLFAQAVIIFLTLSGFINIFTPFTIQKEITEKDIANISLKKFEEKKKEDERNEKIRKENTFG
jgi:hypothetical protein